MSFNYKSPIQLIVDDYQATIEDEVMKVVQNTGIVVDKEELIKALKYDRNQYEKGYEDGHNTKHGEWIDERLDKFRKWKSTCSVCGWYGVSNYDSYVDIYDFSYCPYCGAKMDKECEK